jgi:hypothetical protein
MLSPDERAELDAHVDRSIILIQEIKDGLSKCESRLQEYGFWLSDRQSQLKAEIAASELGPARISGPHSKA